MWWLVFIIDLTGLPVTTETHLSTPVSKRLWAGMLLSVSGTFHGVPKWTWKGGGSISTPLASWVQMHCHQQTCVSPALMDRPHTQTGRQMRPLPHRCRLPHMPTTTNFRSLFYAHVPAAKWDPVALLPQHYWDNKLPKTWMSAFITKETWEGRSALTSCINVSPKLTLNSVFTSWF